MFILDGNVREWKIRSRTVILVVCLVGAGGAACYHRPDGLDPCVSPVICGSICPVSWDESLSNDEYQSALGNAETLSEERCRSICDDTSPYFKSCEASMGTDSGGGWTITCFSKEVEYCK